MLFKRRRQFKPAWRARHPLPTARSSRPVINRAGRGEAVSLGSPRKLFLIIFFGGCLIWFVYFFIYSPQFTVRTVNINGLETIPRAEIDSIVSGYLNSRRGYILPNRNILSFSKQGLEKVISQKYILDSIAIDRSLPWTLNIDVKEKHARLVLRTVAKVEIAQSAEAAPNAPSIAGDTADSTKAAAEEEKPAPAFTLMTSYYYLDVNGIVVSEKEKIDEAELQNLPVVEITTDSQTRVKPGDVVLSGDLVGYMFSVYDAMARSNANIKITNLIYNPAASDEIKFLTTEGWQGFLSRKLSLDTQLRKLELALSEKIKDKRGQGLLYVDLRLKDRVYFK
ncbi:MAG: hypothetical protein AAB880_02905 [Patescibacteria group bacterium]